MPNKYTVNPPVLRTTKQYKSADERGCHTTKPPSGPTYSGTEVIGIATMHKSNLMPVTAGVNTNPKHTQGR